MPHTLDTLIDSLDTFPDTTYTGPAFRMHNPVWAWSPMSMVGASINGGRFNPKGREALYLSLSVHGCHCEVTGGATNAVLDPQMLCSYSVDIDGLLDLREHYAHCFESPWRIDLLDGKVPPGWRFYEEVILHFGINGILVPSYVKGAERERNLVLFRTPENDAVTLHDPDGRLRAIYGDKLDI